MQLKARAPYQEPKAKPQASIAIIAAGTAITDIISAIFSSATYM